MDAEAARGGIIAEISGELVAGDVLTVARWDWVKWEA
jgi:hypothetical protein